MGLMQGETYTVVSGDVLWKIAKMYNLTWERLADMNNLDDPNRLYPGQKLIIRNE
jgi:5'-nucleotidase